MSEIDPLTGLFASSYPDEFARVLVRASAEDRSAIVERLPAPLKASIVARLPAASIGQLLGSGKHAPEAWLADAPVDDALMLVGRIPDDSWRDIVDRLEDRKRRLRLLKHRQYSDLSVGAFTSDTCLRLVAETDAADVLTDLRSPDGEDPGPMVAIDRDGTYLGMIDRWRLLINDPPTGRVADYVVPVRALHPNTSIAAVAKIPEWHTHDWLPVADRRNRVIGGVSRSVVFQVAGQHTHSDRATADVLAGLGADLAYVLAGILERLLSRSNAR